MVDIRVGYFLEDIAQEAFILSLVTRIAEEVGMPETALDHDSRSAIGGRGTVTSELRRFLRDVRRGDERPFDVLVVAIDANCCGYSERRNEIRHIVDQTDYHGTVVYAIPDPHIERWYLEDSQGLREVVDADIQPQTPPYKCERGLYKLALREAFQEAGIHAPLGGAEYGPEIAEVLDLYEVGNADAAFRHFVTDLRAFFTRMKSSLESDLQ